MALRYCKFVRNLKNWFWPGSGVVIVVLVAAAIVYLFGISNEYIVAFLFILALSLGFWMGGMIAPPVQTDPWFKSYQTVIVGGLIAPIATLFAAYAAWTAAQRQIANQQEIFQAQQRPWVKVRVEKGGPLKFTPDGFGSLPLKITVENVGKSPAFNIQLGIWSFLASAVRKDMHAEWKQRCERVRMEPLDNPGRGFILLPGDQVSMEEAGLGPLAVVGIRPDEIAQSLIEENGKKVIDLSFYGCVDYAFSSHKEHHQTGFAFRISQTIDRKDSPPASTFSIEPAGSIPQDKLMLWPSPSTSAQTD